MTERFRVSCAGFHIRRSELSVLERNQREVVVWHLCLATQSACNGLAADSNALALLDLHDDIFAVWRPLKDTVTSPVHSHTFGNRHEDGVSRTFTKIFSLKFTLRLLFQK